MLGVFANNHDFALALDDFALLAHGLHGRSNFHRKNLLMNAFMAPVVGGGKAPRATGR